MTEETIESNETTADSGRPTFLTVLCILTFIGSGLGVLIGLLMIFGMDSLMKSLESMPAIADLMAEAMVGGSPLFALQTISAAGCLFGAIQMWRLKKFGFFIYSGIAILGIVAPLLFGAAFSIFDAVITILFIVFYFLNVKHMN